MPWVISTVKHVNSCMYSRTTSIDGPLATLTNVDPRSGEVLPDVYPAHFQSAIEELDGAAASSDLY